MSGGSATRLQLLELLAEQPEWQLLNAEHIPTTEPQCLAPAPVPAPVPAPAARSSAAQRGSTLGQQPRLRGASPATAASGAGRSATQSKAERQAERMAVAVVGEACSAATHALSQIAIPLAGDALAMLPPEQEGALVRSRRQLRSAQMSFQRLPIEQRRDVRVAMKRLEAALADSSEVRRVREGWGSTACSAALSAFQGGLSALGSASPADLAAAGSAGVAAGSAGVVAGSAGVVAGSAGAALLHAGGPNLSSAIRYALYYRVRFAAGR